MIVCLLETMITGIWAFWQPRSLTEDSKSDRWSTETAGAHCVMQRHPRFTHSVNARVAIKCVDFTISHVDRVYVLRTVQKSDSLHGNQQARTCLQKVDPELLPMLPSL